MSVVSHGGIARPYEEPEPYPAFGDRAAALNGFRLTYLDSDHEITLIQVLAGGESTDLSPFADLQPSRIPDGRLSVLLQDAGPSGEEFGYYAAHSLLTTPGARRYQIRDVGCVNDCRRQVPSYVLRDPFSVPAVAGGALLALVGFRMFFPWNRNHNLDRVGVWFEGDYIHVAMRDAGGGDTFAYLVDFVVIPTAFLNVSTGVERGSGAQAFDTHQLPPVGDARTDFVITGWEFNFRQGDHKIFDIGVKRWEDNLSVFYGDYGGGDPFDWRVQWAQVGPQVSAPLRIV